MLFVVTLLISFALILIGDAAVGPEGHQLDLAKGLVAYWKFDEGEGDIAFDETENQNDGGLLCLGGGCTPPRWVVGKSGFGLQFDGKDDYVLAFLNGGSWSFDNNTSGNGFSVALWVRIAFDSGNQLMPLITKKANANADSPGWALVFNGWLDELQGQISDGTTQMVLGGPEAIAIFDDRWHHIVLTVDRDQNATIYLDGLKLGRAEMRGIGNISNRWPLLIGRFRWGGTSFNGIIDEVRIYNKALSESEVRSLLILQLEQQ